MIRIGAICPVCKEKHYQEFTEEQYLKVIDYFEGRGGKGNIQDALPFLTPEQRELFLSRVCAKCWKSFENED